MALDLPLPKQVFGHPWLLQGDGKMSKSKGNVLYADTLVDFFGVDAVRYFVLHEMPFDNDGVISWELMVERLNSDLANILGNLVNRTISMSNKYFGGVVTSTGVKEEVDEDLKAVVLEAVKKADAKMEQLRLQTPLRTLAFSAAATNTLTRQCHGAWQRMKQRGTSGRSPLQLSRSHYHWRILTGFLYAGYVCKDFSPVKYRKTELRGNGQLRQVSIRQ